MTALPYIPLQNVLEVLYYVKDPSVEDTKLSTNKQHSLSVRREPKPFPLALPPSPLITALSRQSYAREQPRDACKSRCTN